MVDKNNIMEIIIEHQKEIDSLELSKKSINDISVRSAIDSKLSFLYDNMYRYKLQAKAWGLIDFEREYI